MCKLCEIKPVYEFTNNRKLCKRCYVQWFEKKFLYTVRKFKMLDRGDKIFIKNNKDIISRVLLRLIENYSQRGTIEIVKSKSNAKILLPVTADNLSEEMLEELFGGKEKNLINKKEICPLFLFLKKEVLLYAKLKVIGGETKNAKSKFTKLLNSVEKNHPEVKNAMINNYIKYYQK